MSLKTYTGMTSPEARLKAEESRLRTLAARVRIENEDILICRRRRGMVPLAIADRVGVGLRRVVAVLTEAGEEIPGYLITSHEAAGELKPCPHCGKT